MSDLPDRCFRDGLVLRTKLILSMHIHTITLHEMTIK